MSRYPKPGPDHGFLRGVANALLITAAVLVVLFGIGGIVVVLAAEWLGWTP